MNEEIRDVALRNALNGIKNSIPDLNWSFIITGDGSVITTDEGSVDPNMAKAATSFQTLAEKAGSIGGLDHMLINGERGKVYVSCVDDMHLVAGLGKDTDLVCFRTITSAVLPTVLKVLDSLTSALTQAPTPLKPATPTPFSLPRSLESDLTKSLSSEPSFSEEQSATEKEEESVETQDSEETEETEEFQAPELSIPEKTELHKPSPEELPSQQLIVDRFSGFMVKPDTVQLDADILKRWSEELGIEDVSEVDIETFSGKTVRCKAKVINDAKLEGRGLVRIPEKTCQSLDVRRGELVRVKPVANQEGE